MFFGARGIILRYYSTAQLFIWWFAPGRECSLSLMSAHHSERNSCPPSPHVSKVRTD